MPVVIKKMLGILLTLVSTLCLAYAIFGAGFMVCTTQQATHAVGTTFSGWDSAVFEEESMAAIAEEVRSFSVDGTSSDELYATIYEALEAEYPTVANELSVTNLEEATATTGVIQALSGYITSLSAANASDVMEQFTLPESALSHLEDCVTIFTTGHISVGVVAFFGLVGLVALGVLYGRRRCGRTLMAAGLLVLALMLIAGIAAITNFEGLFNLMHEVLFAEGTWTFSADSLLIQLFPEAFWAAMAGLWVITSLICALVCVLVGKLIAGRKRSKRA